MQAEWEGQYLYIYSGRDYEVKKPDMKQVGKEDPFSELQIVKLDSITSIDVNHKDCTITLWLGARPIHCSFGNRNCYKINCFHEFMLVLEEALHIKPAYIWNMKRRNSQTALSVQREDEVQEKD